MSNRFLSSILFVCSLILFTSPLYAKDGDIEICGVIESINSSQVTLNGISYPLENDTEYEDANSSPISLNDFSVGELVQLRIRDGKADRLEKEDESNCGGGFGGGSSGGGGDDNGGDDNSDDSGSGGNENRERVCGMITALTDSTLTVNSQVYTVTQSTEFESKSGDYSLTFSAFSVGDYVKLDIRNGALHEVEPAGSKSTCKSQSIKDSNKQSSNSKSTKKRTRLRTKFSAAQGVNTSARGWVKFISKANNGKSTDRFKVKVTIPLPSDHPSLSDLNDASELQLIVYLFRGDVLLGQCYPELDNSSKSAQAHFKVDLREKKGVFQAKKGNCDVDLAQSGTQGAVPSLLKNDEVVVVLPDLSDFLVGTL